MSDRRLTVVFGEDQSLSFFIPIQRDLPSERISLMNRLSTSENLTMEVDGELYVIPWASIRYLRIDPVLPDDMLPLTVLKGLRLAE